MIKNISLCLLMLFTCSAASKADLPPTDPNVAVIERTASTNVAGWRLEVHSDGTVHHTVLAAAKKQTAKAKTHRVSPALAKKFIGMLKADMPLTKFAETHCAKSASFGTSIYFEYGGQVSPDLDCPDYDPALRPAVKAATAIEKACGM